MGFGLTIERAGHALRLRVEVHRDGLAVAAELRRVAATGRTASRPLLPAPPARKLLAA